MEQKSSKNKLKRPFMEDEDSDKQPTQKRVRFPKGKKTKLEVVEKEDAEAGPKDPRLAAKERAKHRHQITAELFSEEGEGFLDYVSEAEEAYEDDGNRTEDGIQIEAFNLSNEREEGYFDTDGNFVEYVREKEIKDAWLDSIEANPKYTGGSAANGTSNEGNSEDEHIDTVDELSSEEVGTIKRRIANLLEPGETVLQALRRLKGNSNNRKEKMSSATKHIFDQLTEAADKLIQNGEYNVYHEKQDVFEREAEGFERLARARGNGTSGDATLDIFSDGNDPAPGNLLLFASTAGPSVSNANSGSDSYDMFADNEPTTANPSDNGSALPTGSISASQLNTGTLNMAVGDGVLRENYTNYGSDYVYDESSGYYYSTGLGYYYDPTTGLFGSAATNKWYRYNEVTNEYEEVDEVAS